MLKVDEDTGANDLVMDPANDQILYASSYQRRRTACCMNGTSADACARSCTGEGIE